MKRLRVILMIILGLALILVATSFAEEENVKKENVNDLKVYNIPVISSTVIGEIKEKSEVTIHKQIKNWSYVSSGDIEGWVRTFGIEGKIEPAEVNKPQEVETIQEEITKPEEKPTEVTKPEETTNQNNSPEDNSGAEVKQAEITKGIVTVDYANVREKASTDSNIVTTLTKGTTFKVVGETEDWYQIEFTSLENVLYKGYMYKDLMKSVN